MNRAIVLGLAAAAALVIAAAQQPIRKNGPAKQPEAATSELAAAPSEARQWENPYEGQSHAWLAGRKLFRRYCAECHGKDGHGIGKAADLRQGDIQDQPAGVLFWFLKNGNLRQGMPSWSRLPDQQRWQLVTYLKTLGRQD